MPLRILKILRKSLIDYRLNLVLLVPPIVDLIRNSLGSAFASDFFSRNMFDPYVIASVWLDLGVAFLVLLGQGVMTGKVVLDGKTRLAEWITEGRKCFFTVLGISILFGLVTSQLSRLTDLYYFRWVTLANFYSPQSFLISSLFYLLIGIIPRAFFYIWLASAVLDGKRFARSFFDALRALRRQLVVFGQFVLLYFAAETFAGRSLGYVFRGPPFIGYLSLFRVASGVGDMILSPIWFLMAFELYNIQRTLQFDNKRVDRDLGDDDLRLPNEESVIIQP